MGIKLGQKEVEEGGEGRGGGTLVRRGRKCDCFENWSPPLYEDTKRLSERKRTVIGEASVEGAESFSEMILIRLTRSYQKKIFKRIESGVEFNFKEASITKAVRNALLKDILSVGFSKMKNISTNDLEKEVISFTSTKEHGERISQLISILSSCVTHTIDVVAKKVMGNKSAWNRREFIPEIISECVTKLVFSDLSSIGLKWSDFVLNLSSKFPSKGTDHFGVIYQIFGAASVTVERIVQGVQKETEHHSFFDVNGVIPLNPLLLAAYMIEISQKCHSASRVIDALRYNSSSRGSIALLIALSNEEEREYVAARIDSGVSNLVKVAEDLSRHLKYVGEVLRTCITHLKVN